MNKAQREFSQAAFANIDDYRELENYTLYTLRVILSNNRIGNAEKIRTMQEINRMSEDRQQQIAAEEEAAAAEREAAKRFTVMYDWEDEDGTKTLGIEKKYSSRRIAEVALEILRLSPGATHIELIEY